MTETALEQAYRRWLRWFPRSFRREHEDEVLSVLLAASVPGQQRADPHECLHLVLGGLQMRLRSRIPRGDRATFNAIRLMYVGVAVDLAVATTIVATLGRIHARILERQPDYTSAQWHAELTGQLEPLIVVSCLLTLFWLFMAWTNGRRYLWARIVFAVFVAVNLASLFNGIANGSATYTPEALVAGSVLCLLELAILALVFQQDLRRSTRRTNVPTTQSNELHGLTVSERGVAPARQGTAARAAQSTEALIVEHLSKRFGDRVAVDDLSFTVTAGEVFGFLGPNGAGKTTTVRMLATLISPSSGSALVAGVPLEPASAVEIRRRIAVMPESPGLYLRLTVTENLEFFAGLYGLHGAQRRIRETLEAVNLEARASDLCGSLSKGLRQRVALARTLLSDPAIVFLDEPTSGLDPVASREVHELIDRLRERGVTVFLTTHRLEEAERLCDRVAILNTSLRTIGRPDELRDRLFTQTLEIRTAEPLRDPERVFTVDGVESWRPGQRTSYVLSVTDARAAAPAVTRALVAAGADVLSLGEVRHSLEDVYLQLIDDDVEATR